MSLIVLDVLSHDFVAGSSSGMRYVTWVANVESRIFDNTIRCTFAPRSNANNLAKIGEHLHTL